MSLWNHFHVSTELLNWIDTWCTNTLGAQVDGDNITSLVSKAASVGYQLKQGTRNTFSLHTCWTGSTHAKTNARPVKEGMIKRKVLFYITFNRVRLMKRRFWLLLWKKLKTHFPFKQILVSLAHRCGPGSIQPERLVLMAAQDVNIDSVNLN